ncbi:MAG: response regulator transcription factor [Planctomycetota bacterium]|nr:MAG: response regulator transcription factor [Planctomycetota bacterium]
MIKIVIADDHQLVREGIKRILAEEEEFEIVAEASNGEQVIDMVREHNPDVVLMDITMPGFDGMETTRRLIKNRTKTLRVVILTMHADEHYAARLMRMGATGYVVKDAAPSELAEAIRTAHQGRRYVSTPLRDSLALRFIEGLEDEPIDTLTDREFQVLSRLAMGATNREIADELSVSVKTIDAHRLNLLAKLRLRNNSELTKFAMQNGIIQV